MSTKTSCDICKKIKNSKNKNGWFSLSMNTGFENNKEYGLNSNYNHWDLCPKCSNYKIPEILLILNKD